MSPAWLAPRRERLRQDVRVKVAFRPVSSSVGRGLVWLASSRATWAAVSRTARVSARPAATKMTPMSSGTGRRP